MAHLAPRRRDVVTFFKKSLAKGFPPYVGESDVYLLRTGQRKLKDYHPEGIQEPEDPELDALYEKYLELLDGDPKETTGRKPFQKTK